MKKSGLISLVLITAALASCHTSRPYGSSDPVYYDPESVPPENDSSYIESYTYNPWQWFYSFRPYATYYGAHCNRHVFGYGSSIKSSGKLAHSGHIASVRGGFGRASSSVS